MTARAVTFVDRRGDTDRRRTLLAVRYPDRRLGYPRRVAHSPGRLRYFQALRAYGDNALLVGLALALVVALNAFDLMATLHFLDLGAREANPVVAFLLESNFGLGVALKLSVGLVVPIGIWLLRRYRRALEASLLLVAIFGMLAAYHVLLLTAVHV